MKVSVVYARAVKRRKAMMDYIIVWRVHVQNSSLQERCFYHPCVELPVSIL
jgi:hypothetical protein